MTPGTWSIASGGYHDSNANLKVYADMRVEENTDPERGAVHPSGWLVSGSNPPDGGISGLLEVRLTAPTGLPCTPRRARGSQLIWGCLSPYAGSRVET